MIAHATPYVGGCAPRASVGAHLGSRHAFACIHRRVPTAIKGDRGCRSCRRRYHAFRSGRLRLGRRLIHRGQFVVIVVPGDYGKPRPALVVQSDLFADLPSVVICPLTTTLRSDAGQFRLDVSPSKENGLRQPSQIAIDKLTVVPTMKIGQVIGQADTDLMLQVSRGLAVFLGIV